MVLPDGTFGGNDAVESTSSSPTIGQLPDGDLAMYFGTDAGYLYIWRENWVVQAKIPLGGEIRGGVTINEDYGELYVVAAGKLWCFPLDGGGGVPLWTVDLGYIQDAGAPGITPVLSNDSQTIYVGNGLDSFFAIDRRSREIIWRLELMVWTETNPAIGPDGTIYVRCGWPMGDYNILYAISPDSEILWSRFLGYGPCGEPTVDASGTVYIGFDNKLYAFGSDGSEKWAFPADQDPVLGEQTPAIGPDGTLYMGDVAIDESP